MHKYNTLLISLHQIRFIITHVSAAKPSSRSDCDSFAVETRVSFI
jgi:hypothetical protein